MIDFINKVSVQNIVKDTLQGCDDGELYIEDTLNESFLFDDNVLKNSSFTKSKGFGLRAINGELIGYSHSNSFDVSSLKSAAETVSAVKKGYAGQSGIEPLKTNKKLYTDKNPIDSVEYKKKIKLLNDINEYARKLDSRTRQVSISLSGSHQKIHILRPLLDQVPQL